MPTIETIAAILTQRSLADFRGIKEDQWFDAKKSPAYDLLTPAGRFELAKDVSSFANAEGGFIIIGLTTIEVPEEQTERVVDLDLLTETSLNVPAIQGVLAGHLYPRVPGIQVSWVEDANSAGLGVGVISVPRL